jgi:hypothetical protein
MDRLLNIAGREILVRIEQHQVTEEKAEDGSTKVTLKATVLGVLPNDTERLAAARDVTPRKQLPRG